MHEPVQVELHLRRGVPVLEREHGAPVQSQDLLPRKSSPKSSSMRLPSLSSREAKKAFTISFCAFWLRPNSLFVTNSSPRLWVTRLSESFGSSLLSQ